MARLSKKDKKLKRINHTKFELSLLMMGFSFLVEQYKKALESGASESEDYMLLINKIIKKLKLIMRVYKLYHKEVIEVVNEVIIKNSSIPNNYLLVGISILSLHREIRPLMILINLSTEADELIDMYASEDNSSSLSENAVYTELLIEQLKERFVGKNNND